MNAIQTLRSLIILQLAAASIVFAPHAAATLLPIQQVQSADFTTSGALNLPEAQSGRALAVSGNWLAVGAPARPDTGRGSVTVYERVAGAWLRRATIHEPPQQLGTGFGSAVDIDESGGQVTVIIGAPLHDSGGFTSSGAAWVYNDQDAGPAVSFLGVGVGFVGTPENDGRFGTAVALHGDWAAVSEPGDGALDNGLVSIRFRHQNGTHGWGQVATKSGTALAGFGASLDLHGEYLIVGAPQASMSEATCGQAHVYRRDEGFANSWGITWTLSPTVCQDGAAFGSSVGVWDSDLGSAFSAARSVVGAPQTAVAGFPAVGAVHFFQDAAAVGALSPPGNATTRGGQAGYSVALDGTSALAGAPGISVSGAPAVGRVHSYAFDGSAWSNATMDIAQTGAAARNQFGWSVDVSGDLGVAGAPGTRFDTTGLPPGAVRAGSTDSLLRSGGTWAVQARLDLLNTLPVTSVSQLFGGGVAMTNDWMAVGAPQDAQLGTHAGAIYLYRRNGDTWVPHSKLTHQYSQPEQRFGEVLAIDGDRLVVGLPNNTSFPAGVATGGMAVVYRYDGSVWAQVATLQSPNVVAAGQFGMGVDISGDVVVVSAPGELSDRGRLYVYRDLTAFATPMVLEINGTVAGDRTGTSVAVDDPAPGVPNNEVIAAGIPFVGGGVGIGLVLYGSNFSIRTPLIDPAAVPNGRLGTDIDVHQSRVVISRPGQAAGQGRVYVYSGSFYQTREALPLPGDLAHSPRIPVAIHGNTAIAGFRDADAGRGRALGFRSSGGVWSLSDDVQPGNTVTGDQFGSAVATYAGRAVIGAPLHDPGALSNAGTAYAYIPAPEFTVVPGTLALSESSPTDGTQRFTLDRAPTANVTFSLSFDDTQIRINTGSGFGASPQTVTMTPANALTGVDIVVRALDDAIDEATPHAATIVTGASVSSDALFNNLVVPDPVVSIADNDQAGVLIQRSGGGNAVVESGSGSTDSYAVVLTSQPVAPVSVDITSAAGDVTLNGDGDGSVTLTFNAANWNMAQTINLAAINDRALEGTQSVNLVHAFSSTDPNYQGITAVVDGTASTNTTPVRITDNELAVVGWLQSAMTTDEGVVDAARLRLQFTVNGSGPEVVETAISYQVTFAPGTAVAADVGVLSGTMGFAEGTPNGQINIVNLPIVDDALAEPTENFTLSASILTGPDSMIVGNPTLAVSILDNDVASIVVTQSSGTAVAEGGSGDSVSVVLTSEPFAPVSVQVTTGTQLDAAPLLLEFDAGNWSQSRTVAVSARDDAIAEGTHSGQLQFASTSSDAAYQGFTIAPVAVTITDNDNAGAALVQSDGSSEVHEGGASDTVTIALTSEPTAPVRITLQPDTQLGVSPVTLDFTAANWQLPQPVTIDAVDDVAVEGAHSGTLTFVSSSADAFYQDLALTPVVVAIVDNDSIPEITLVPPLSRQQGSPGSVSAIASVTDEHQASGTLVVSVVPGGSAAGIAVTDIVNDSGAISAQLTASCAATAGTVRLEVVDSGGLRSTADLQVDVAANTPPVLSYDAVSVLLAGQIAQSPASGPSDNGSVDAIAVQSVGAFTGTASVVASGQVQLVDAGPVGTHAIVIRATDNCGAVHDAALGVDVARAQSFKTLTSDLASSRFRQSVTFTAELAGVNPTGSVRFFAGALHLGDAALVPGAVGGNNLKQATLTTSDLPIGLSQVRVEYAGDTNNLASVSADLAHTVTAADTRIVVTPAINPAPFGSVEMHVQVSAAAPGGGVPEGTVLLALDVSDPPCTLTLAGGQGSCMLGFSSAGYVTILATYTPSGTEHLTSTGSGTIVVVGDPSDTDLRVRIGNGVDVVQPGQVLYYQIVADNPGDTAAVGRLQVPLAPIFASGAWQCLSASGSACPVGAGQGYGNDSIDVDLSLDAGAAVIYELQVTVPGLPEGPVVQSASLTPRDPTTDPLPGNNTATDTDTMGLFGDGYEEDSTDE